MERKERGEKDGEGGDVWKERENYGWGEKNSLAVWVKENVFVFLPPHPASRVEIGESVLQEVFKLFLLKKKTWKEVEVWFYVGNIMYLLWSKIND